MKARTGTWESDAGGTILMTYEMTITNAMMTGFIRRLTVRHTTPFSPTKVHSTILCFIFLLVKSHH